MSKPLGLRALAVAWTLVILAALLLPGDSIPEVSLVGFDKLAHLTVFLVFGWLWMAALDLPSARRAWWVFVGGCVYAVGTELLQAGLPLGRSPEVFDLAADALGTLVGVLAYRFAERRRNPDIL